MSFSGTTKKMTAAVVRGPGQVVMERVDVPEPGPADVRVRLEGCGVCGSNLELWTGQPWFRYPMTPGAPGHEGWGVVEAVGHDVENVRLGDRVALLSGCAFAEYDIAPQSSLVVLPSVLADRPFPGEALGCAMNIFRRSEIKAGQTVAIVGIGFLGAILTRLAIRAGARVIAISRRPFALDVAYEMGARDRVLLVDLWQSVEQVRNITGGKGVERVIEAVGKQSTLDLATELVAERGRLIVAGYHQDGPRQVNMQLWNWCGLDVINAHERDPAVYLQGMRSAVEAVTSGQINPGALYTNVFPLERLGDAFEMMRTRPDGFLKGLIEL